MKEINAIHYQKIFFFGSICFFFLKCQDSQIKTEFGKLQLSKMEARKELSHIRSPDFFKDNLSEKNISEGHKIYNTYCVACHQSNGKGASGRFPPLNRTDWVIGDQERLVHLILNGMEGPIKVNGEDYNGIMPQHAFLKNIEIAKVLTYIRSHFGNNASPIRSDQVKKYRESYSNNKTK